MVDKTWFDWQSKSAANLAAFGGRPIGGQTITVRERKKLAEHYADLLPLNVDVNVDA